LAAREALAAFDNAGARACITAERAVLAKLEAGCSAPIGALAEIRANPAELTLTAVVTAADGSDAVRRTLTGVVTDPAGVGRRLAADLIASGADKMMGSSS
jgi:hydroxymethylbilane synthase